MRFILSRLLAASLIALFSVWLYNTLWFQELEYSGLDLWFSLRKPEKAPEDVIVIALDEESYDNLEVPMNKPWPRTLHAQLLRRLAKAGARKVVFDVIFGGPSDSEEADMELAEAFGLLPTAIGVEVIQITDEAQTEAAVQMDVETDKEKIFLPYAPFQKTVAELASVKKRTDGRFLRRFARTIHDDERNRDYRSLAAAGANLPEGSLLPDDNDLIWFYGPSRTVKTVPYFDALDEEWVPDAEFTDKVIYVGLALQTALGPAQKDAFRTPFPERGDTFGVEIHATAALNLIHKQWIERFPFEREALTYGASVFTLAMLMFLLPPGI
ncbi:MAG: CHASE2 domain-containing protein, partial [Bdellovibrionales bacterium]|nr:CHASE2 domain-containing protein [Bdellovibrionales bacterium]